MIVIGHAAKGKLVLRRSTTPHGYKFDLDRVTSHNRHGSPTAYASPNLPATEDVVIVLPAPLQSLPSIYLGTSVDFALERILDLSPNTPGLGQWAARIATVFETI